MKDKLKNLNKQLNQKYLERTELINILLIAYLIKEHIFIGGPPGTGKTSLAKDLTLAMQGKSFYYLMNKTTTIDEILGPLDFAALNQNIFQRDLSRGIANAEIIILDEGFKANSVVLNTLLGLLLDREVVNNNQIVKCPLNTAIICSNELPEDESLAPFWDRLAFRIWVENISESKKIKLMMSLINNINNDITENINTSDLQNYRKQIEQIKIPKFIVESVVNITSEVEKEIGIKTSTRKHNQIIPILKASAFLNNKLEVDEEDLLILVYVLWNTLEDIPKITEILNKFSSPEKEEIINILNNAYKESQKIIPFAKSLETSRSVWIQQQSQIAIIIEENLSAIMDIGTKKPSIKTKGYYSLAINKISEMLETINKLNQEAYQ